MTERNDRLYVYALAQPGLPRQFTVLRHRLRSLPLDGVDVVVEHRPPPDFTTDAVRRQHAVVTRLAARQPAILPARFGSIADEASLRSLVSRRRKEILAALEQVRGCVQMTVRIVIPTIPTAPMVATPSPGLADARSGEPLSSARTGTEFLQRRLERARHVPHEVEIVRRELGSLVRSERVAAGEREGLVTVFHLVPHQDLDAYRRHASRLQSKLQPRTVSVTGPWPVFAFAPELF
jgi:hypothetical protein